MTQSRTIRAVAFFEGFKGAVVLLAGTGLLSLVHRNINAIAAVFIDHMHLNPASKYPQIFLTSAAELSDSQLLLLAAGAAIYATVRFMEAYGLFYERVWAESLAALSSAIYVPLELFALIRKATWHGAALLALNIAIVAIMVHALLKRRAKTATRAA